MRIGIFGGTFNPPHRGHVEAARAVQRQLGLDKILLIPAGLPPHKSLPENTPSPVHRLRMARLCAREIPGAEVSDIELARSGKSYTVDTVRELAGRYPGDALWLIVGDDMLESFAQWRQPQDIAAHCRLAAVMRQPDKAGDIARAAQELHSRLGAQVDIVDNTVYPISSTQYRAGGKGELLLQAVADYIADNALYRPRPAPDAIRTAVGQVLSPKRFGHTLGVEQTAVQLAARWGEDEGDARTAALLHDCTRELKAKEQLNLIEKYDIINQYDPDRYPYLLHAETAAAVALHEYGASPAVARAIGTHTLGAVKLDLLGKIIFVADAVEPGRDYKEAAALRELAFCDLDAAVIACMEQTAHYLRSVGKEPHPESVRILQDMKRESGK